MWMMLTRTISALTRECQIDSEPTDQHLGNVNMERVIWKVTGWFASPMSTVIVNRDGAR
jgi:hypothetical protein